MKTPEEWFDIQSPYLAKQRRQFGPDFHQSQVDLIKQIQLDAWKQGMTDAAEICNTGFYEHMECKREIELKLNETITNNS